MNLLKLTSNIMFPEQHGGNSDSELQMGDTLSGVVQFYN